jgi:hypothetical protein
MKTHGFILILSSLRYAALKQFVIKMRINRANARQIRIKSFPSRTRQDLISISISFEIIHALECKTITTSGQG